MAKIKEKESARVLLKSKTFWAGTLLIGLGIVSAYEGKMEEAAQLVLTGLGFIGLRDAIRKLK